MYPNSVILSLTCIRFVFAHLHMKCRRAVILEYFGEVKANDPAYPCCDVCESSNTVMMSDCCCEIKAVVQAINDLPNSGEKKVLFTHTHTCTLHMELNLKYLYITG